MLYSNLKQRRQDSVVSFDHIEQSHQKHKAPMFSISLVPPVKSIHSILQKNSRKGVAEQTEVPWKLMNVEVSCMTKPGTLLYTLGNQKSGNQNYPSNETQCKKQPLCTYSIFLCFLLITILILAQCKYLTLNLYGKNNKKIPLPIKRVTRDHDFRDLKR